MKSPSLLSSLLIFVISIAALVAFLPVILGLLAVFGVPVLFVLAIATLT